MPEPVRIKCNSCKKLIDNSPIEKCNIMKVSGIDGKIFQIRLQSKERHCKLCLVKMFAKNFEYKGL